MGDILKITNCGRGVHKREVKGLSSLSQLPSNWYAYTNLDLATAPGSSREIDVIIVADDRIFLIDIKDWHGPIESREGKWYNKGRNHGPSPVQKINQNARDVFLLLKTHLAKHKKGSLVPRVHGLVVLTGTSDLSGIAITEVANVMYIDDFVAAVTSVPRRVETFGAVPPPIVENPLTGPEWKNQLSKFFNTSKGTFLPGRRDYNGYFATSEAATFKHPRGIYSEFEASDERTPPEFGVLRLWDFSKADAHFQTPEGRAEIAGREQSVVSYLRDRSERCDDIILSGRTRDTDYSVAYWEVFERRRRLSRLMDLPAAEVLELSREERVELARQVLSALDALHLAEASHLDVGAHSIWLQRPSTVRISHLMAASYPQVETLGESRYQFLSASTTPEDALGEAGSPKQRDVFLAALAVHRILWGAPPDAIDDNPPEWRGEVDADGTFAELHEWFDRALAWDLSLRFPDAGEALSAFNAATAQRPTPAEVLTGLDRHRGRVRSQLQLYQEFPPVEVLKDTGTKTIWRSKDQGQDVLVKIWKSSSWGDQVREGARILDFLDRLQGLVDSPPKGCTRVLDKFWLGDAIVLVQEWVDQPTLASILERPPENWSSTMAPRQFALALAELIETLHSQSIGHGDLKPANILVDPAQPDDPLLIDLAEFTPAHEGDPRTTAYSPAVGGRYERDCFAVTKITEEVLGKPDDASCLAKAIDKIRQKQPANSTLLPLIEALRSAPTSEEPEIQRIELASRFMSPGELLPDEGLYHLRTSRYGRTLVLRGACEEIEVEFDAERRPVRAHRRSVDQGRIAGFAKHEFAAFNGIIEVLDGMAVDLRGLNVLLDRNDVREALAPTATPTDPDPRLQESQSAEETEDAVGELLQDTVSETITAEPSPTGEIDVSALWERLMAVEGEQTTFGETLQESAFNREAKRHVVAFEQLGGSFDYDRRDRVLVERQDDRGNWRALAHLDLQRSKPDHLFLDTVRFDRGRGGPLVQQYQRLRFRSHFEQTSLDRRNTAVTRILKRDSRIPDLISLFDPRENRAPLKLPAKLTAAELQDRYGLNPFQGDALASVLALRPMSLVQGPPGTGKTVFIAALVHAALTSGLAKNVLLASQAHEAVNNAAEAVLKLFGRTDEKPNILRIGNENVVSDRLLPFHAERVERLYKDRFQAEMRERLTLAAEGLGLPQELASRLTHVELAVRPVARRLSELVEESCDDQVGRLNSLRETLAQQVTAIGLHWPDFEGSPPDELVEALTEASLEKTALGKRPSPDKAARFRRTAALGRDYVASVSTEQRSFETFLAGTREIVAGTCVGLGRSSLGLTKTPFDLVVVDEAARCTASELAVPLQAAKWVVLVGDHLQLKPLHQKAVIEQVADELRIGTAEIVRSDFERVFETSYGRAAGHTLKRQYRMLPAIGRIVSESFYGGVLDHGREAPVIPPEVLPPDLDHPVAWIDTGPLGERGRQSDPSRLMSLSNGAEADCIVALLKRWSESPQFVEWLAAENQYAHGIGLICSYAAQRDLLRRKINGAPIAPALRSALKIDTIDSYQGKENPIVIVSLVRNNWDGAMEDGVATIRPGFLAEPNRINVAISRAMDRLVIVGCKSRWRRSSPMANIGVAFGRGEERGEAIAIDAATLLDQPGERSLENSEEARQ